MFAKIPSLIGITTTYNGDGQRVERDDSVTGKTRLIWEGNNLLAETDDSDVIQVLYTRDPQAGLMSRKATTASYFHFDGGGSTREFTDASENVEGVIVYDSFGNIKSETFGSGMKPGFLWNAFTGLWYDLDLDEYLTLGSVFSPVIGRLLNGIDFLDAFAGLFGPQYIAELDGGPGRYLFQSDEPPDNWTGQHGSPKNLVELVRMAAKWAKKDKTCIKELAIEGHASPWGMDIKKEGTYSTETGLDPKKIERIDFFNPITVGNKLNSLNFCCPCIIYLGGCNAGLADWPQQIADITGCTLIAPGGSSSGSYLTGTKDIYEDEDYPGPIEFRSFKYWFLNNQERKRQLKIRKSTDHKHIIFKPKKYRSCDGKTNPGPPEHIITYWKKYHNNVCSRDYFKRNRKKRQPKFEEWYLYPKAFNPF